MKQVLILSFALYVVGCHSITSQDFETIHVTENIVDAISIDDIFSEYKFVCLEATDSSLVGDSRKIVVKNDVIYVLDDQKIIQFSIQGGYLRTLDKLGRGPHEYLGIWDFCIFGDEIIIWDQKSRSLFRYSLDNTYIDSFKLDDFAATICPIDKDRLLFSSNYQQNDEFKFMIRDLRTMNLLSSFYPINKAQINYRHFMGQQNYYAYKNTLLFHEPMNNFIYKIEDYECKPVYCIDIYGQNPPIGFWEQEYEYVGEARRIAQEKRYCYGLPVFAESNEQIIFSFQCEDKYLLCTYLKETGKSVQSEKMRLFPCMPACKIGGMCSDSEDCFLLILESGDFFKDGIPYVDELSYIFNNGNPVICIAKLK